MAFSGVFYLLVWDSYYIARDLCTQRISYSVMVNSSQVFSKSNVTERVITGNACCWEISPQKSQGKGLCARLSSALQTLCSPPWEADHTCTTSQASRRPMALLCAAVPTQRPPFGTTRQRSVERWKEHQLWARHTSLSFQRLVFKVLPCARQCAASIAVKSINHRPCSPWAWGQPQCRPLDVESKPTCNLKCISTYNEEVTSECSNFNNPCILTQ